MESSSIDVEGIRMHWEEEGQGSPVVFIHRIPTSPRLWRHVIPHIRGTHSMAWEMVGYGISIEEAPTATSPWPIKQTIWRPGCGR